MKITYNGCLIEASTEEIKDIVAAVASINNTGLQNLSAVGELFDKAADIVINKIMPAVAISDSKRVPYEEEHRKSIQLQHDLDMQKLERKAELKKDGIDVY